MTPPDFMTPYLRHLLAASGYLELGLPLEADEELAQIEPEMHAQPEVLGMRACIYQELKQWAPMRDVSLLLCAQHPDEPQWPIMLAYATRRCLTIEDALPILEKAAGRFPEEGTILFNLACYHAQLGSLDDARARLNEAIAQDAKWRAVALADPDLSALHEELRRGET